MASISAPPLALSQVGRAMHDVGLAGLLGGNMFGRFALHPAVTELGDARERGKVVNAAWKRYGAINSLSLLAVTTGWLGARLDEAADGRLSPPERRLARAKDVLVGVVAVTGIATAAEGIRFSRSAPDGAVPLRDGDHAAAEARPDSRALKRRLARAQAVLVGSVAITGLAPAAEGRRCARSAPGGAVPLRDGDHAADEAKAHSRSLKRRVNVLGGISLGAEAGLVAVNAALNQRNFRRPPARRLVPRLGRV